MREGSQRLPGRPRSTARCGNGVIASRPRLEGADGYGADGYGAAKASFAAVIGQIVVLDVVFSLDSVITAVGMVDELFIMIAAVMIAIASCFCPPGVLNLRYQTVATRRRQKKQLQTIDAPVHLRPAYVESGAHGVTLPRPERKP